MAPPHVQNCFLLLVSAAPKAITQTELLQWNDRFANLESKLDSKGRTNAKPILQTFLVPWFYVDSGPLCGIWPKFAIQLWAPTKFTTWPCTWFVHPTGLYGMQQDHTLTQTTSKMSQSSTCWTSLCLSLSNKSKRIMKKEGEELVLHDATSHCK